MAETLREGISDGRCVLVIHDNLSAMLPRGMGSLIYQQFEHKAIEALGRGTVQPEKALRRLKHTVALEAPPAALIAPQPVAQHQSITQAVVTDGARDFGDSREGLNSLHARRRTGFVSIKPV